MIGGVNEIYALIRVVKYYLKKYPQGCDPKLKVKIEEALREMSPNLRQIEAKVGHLSHDYRLNNHYIEADFSYYLKKHPTLKDDLELDDKSLEMKL